MRIFDSKISSKEYKDLFAVEIFGYRNFDCEKNAFTKFLCDRT